ncbi:aminotransferase class I/II-fold pyridoxal phosphate-dependent enzyme [Microvirga sp. HBU67558]|uniref:aminotransferase class I/II-fold pyridoxal phosphate-dependent enzyme n=1 Tax=Microvirga TaxID=186650 RepID=UPI001B395724|nr:aminotransferase class I/II-fold pyridoxal phosphate-dependent enzyme [Microvirga sp. HBU67655]MBQ0823879.1 aminotransferase class I/II-fold pyridoxal phosphate-dependent enzyme [Microvirga sp. HBU67558]
MQFDTFLMERNQTLYENGVEINLTESGVHPCTIEEILPADHAQALLRQPLGYGWTDGRPDLRAAIANWYPGASASNVLVTNGSSEATMIALMALVDPGDKVLFAVPNFMQVDGLGRALGMSIERLPLLADHGWQIDPEGLGAAMDGVKLICVTNPGNPTGVVLSSRSRDALLAAAQKAGAWLMVDEIYRGGEIDGAETETFYGGYSRVIVTSSLSKSFACPGLRLGWIVGPEGVVEEAAKRQDYTTIGSGILSQILGAAVMEPGNRERILARGRTLLRANADIVEGWVEKRNRWSWQRPAAGGMAFLHYDFDMPSEELSNRLREEESVFVVAGAWFGIERHIRLGIGVKTEDLVEGLARLDAFLVRHGLG